MEGVFSSDPEVLPTNIPYMAVCSSVALFLAVILLVYQFKFNDSPPIVSILALLLFNQLVMLLFEIPGYFAYIPNWVCLTSIVGTTFFRLAQCSFFTYSDYWLFFVTRLLYREKAAPGKLKDLSSYIRKNVVFTYFPSVVVSVVVLVVANIEDTISEANCWHLIKERTYSDYIIYLSCFILPNLLSLVATLIYFIAFFVIQSKAKKSICIYFPITALPFMIYDLVLRMLTFFGEFQSN